MPALYAHLLAEVETLKILDQHEDKTDLAKWNHDIFAKVAKSAQTADGLVRLPGVEGPNNIYISCISLTIL